MQRNHLQEKGYKQLLVKNETRAARKIFISDHILNFNFFHVFVVKVLNIISLDQKRNMHIFYKIRFQS